MKLEKKWFEELKKTKDICEQAVVDYSEKNIGDFEIKFNLVNNRLISLIAEIEDDNKEKPNDCAVAEFIQELSENPVILDGVNEYFENYNVKLSLEDGRILIIAINEGGHNETAVDLLQLLAWIKKRKPFLLATASL